MTTLARFTGTVVNNRYFRSLIFSVILLSAVIVGLETYRDIASAYGPLLHLLDQIIIWIFVVEITMKILAEGNRPFNYFRDPWNIFDFLIVAICLVPAVDTHFVAVLRIARILRVLRMISLFPKLQLLVGALLKSVPSMGYVILLLTLVFYIYAVMGSFMFGTSDPLHFGNLHLSMITLFKVLTLEGWTDILHVHLYSDPIGGSAPVEITSIWPFIYFVSFILIGAMIIMNLFIGVIMNSMEESQKEMDEQLRPLNPPATSEEIIKGIETKIDELGRELVKLRETLHKQDPK